MRILEAWAFLQQYFKKNPKDFEVNLYFDCKKDKYFVNLNVNPEKNQKYSEVFLGCWSRRAEFPRFNLFIQEIKTLYSLSDSSELSKKAKEFVCNGAGPKGLGWIVPDFCYSEAANNHDLRYTIGGSEEDRKFADYNFLWEMKRKGGKFLPYLYFWAVRFGGKSAFEYRNRKMTVKEINESF